jgi:hypothetical protein
MKTMKKVIMIASVMFSLVVTSCTLNVNTQDKPLTYEEKLDSIRNTSHAIFLENETRKLIVRSSEIDSLLKLNGADIKTLTNEQNTIESAIIVTKMMFDKYVYENDKYDSNTKGGNK